MKPTESAIARLIDESAIRDAAARFADTCIRGDHGGFRRLWAEDGVWVIGKPFEVRCEGVEAIADMLHHLRDEREFFVQYLPQAVIDINGDEATARWVCREIARGPGETYYENLAFYHDRLRRAGDRWVFSERAYEYIWLNTAPFPGDVFKLDESSSI
ncbi:hypothetical protein SM14VA4_49220 (plasmid) [Serratia marcescens]|nr:hypothetical protein SM14VA4_49220 [Serratia marcescens]